MQPLARDVCVQQTGASQAEEPVEVSACTHLVFTPFPRTPGTVTAG